MTQHGSKLNRLTRLSYCCDYCDGMNPHFHCFRGVQHNSLHTNKSDLIEILRQKIRRCDLSTLKKSSRLVENSVSSEKFKIYYLIGPPCTSEQTIENQYIDA